MRYSAAIELGIVTYAVDAIGQQIEEATWRSVFANEFTMAHAEFYAAGQVGMKPERQYQLRSCDYAGEPRARVDGAEYNIIRSDRRGEWVRITLGRVVANG